MICHPPNKNEVWLNLRSGRYCNVTRQLRAKKTLLTVKTRIHCFDLIPYCTLTCVVEFCSESVTDKPIQLKQMCLQLLWPTCYSVWHSCRGTCQEHKPISTCTASVPARRTRSRCAVALTTAPGASGATLPTQRFRTVSLLPSSVASGGDCY